MRRVVIGVALVFASSTPGFGSDPDASPLTQSQVSMAAYVLVADRLTADPYQWYSAAGLRVALKGESTDLSREQAVKIVAQIQRADYEGDRTALEPALRSSFCRLLTNLNLHLVFDTGVDLRNCAGPLAGLARLLPRRILQKI